MADTSELDLGSTIRTNPFSETISISPSETNELVLVTCSPEGGSIGGVNIVITLTGLTPKNYYTQAQIVISGQYLGGFNDRALYVSKGSSDKIETPKVVVGSLWGPDSKLPPNQDLFEFSQDPTSDKDINYNIFVSEIDPTTNVYTNTNFVATHTLRNDWSSGTAALKAYYGT